MFDLGQGRVGQGSVITRYVHQSKLSWKKTQIAIIAQCDVINNMCCQMEKE